MKILIIGIVASGKTTLARKLSIANNIPYFEIDQIVHDDINNKKRSIEEQRNIINSINQNNDSWIIEGTLRKNMDYLLEMANKIIYMDLPIRERRKRIIIRYLKQKIGIEKCSYKPSIKMLSMMYKWTNEYEKNKENMNNRLNKYRNKIIILDSVKKVADYSL